MTERPELLNAARDAEAVSRCTTAGDPNLGGIQVVEHDYREITDPNAFGPGRPRTYLRCVWCHAVACGNASDPDPCIEPWHHGAKDHRTAGGVTWPIGSTRPAVTQ